MLVLSRKAQERVVFPSLNISIELTRVAGKIARLAIDAPREIPILRGELVDQDLSSRFETEAREKRHALRNKLNTAHLALGLLQKQVEHSGVHINQQAVQHAIEALSELDSCVTQGDALEADKTKTALRVLIVEDNDHERELLMGYLALSGYAVDAVPDGLAALEYLSTRAAPDLVLLDMQMPKLDGRETVAAIRRNAELRGLKVFALSGMERGAWHLPVGRQGVDRWFTKPIRPDVLTEQLSRELCTQN